MMTLSVSQVIAYLRSMDRVILAVSLLAVVGLVYAGNLSLEWWANSSTANDLSAQAQSLRSALARGASDPALSASELDERRALLEEQTSRFSFATDDAIIGLVDDISREARVRLTSATTRDSGNRTEGPTQFRVLLINLRVEGQVTHIFDYIDLVSTAVPGMSVVSAQLGGFSTAPFATLELELLLDPAPAPEESES